VQLVLAKKWNGSCYVCDFSPSKKREYPYFRRTKFGVDLVTERCSRQIFGAQKFGVKSGCRGFGLGWVLPWRWRRRVPRPTRWSCRRWGRRCRRRPSTAGRRRSTCLASGAVTSPAGCTCCQRDLRRRCTDRRRSTESPPAPDRTACSTAGRPTGTPLQCSCHPVQRHSTPASRLQNSSYACTVISC